MNDNISLDAAKQQIQESENRFQQLVEQAPIGICIIDAETIIAENINQRFVEIAGKPYEEILGNHYWQTFAETAPYFKSALQQVIDNGIKFTADEAELKLIRHGISESVNLTFVYDPLKDKDGKTRKVAIWVMENTERMKAQKKVEDTERSLRNILLKAPVAMCIFRGKEFVIEIANEKMFEFWGRGGTGVIGKPLFTALPEARDQGYEQLLSNVLNTGQSFSADEMPVVLPRNGKAEKVFINFAYEPVYEIDDTISGILATAIDVTAQVLGRHTIEAVVIERTRELAEANKKLEENNKDLQQFAYIASHDLQEPVRKVSTFTQMLRKNLGEVDERTTFYLDKIQTAAHRMLVLIKDVLSFSQLSHDRYKYQVVSLSEIVETLRIDFELLIEEKQAKIIANNLPDIEAIPLHMTQLFGNLVSNALKFSRAEVLPVISLNAKSLSKEDLKMYPDLDPSLEYFDIRLSDNGIGFDQENANDIFDIFKRLHGKYEYEGTGIGLAICKKIALNHRGNLYATSALNNGATFNILLPKKQS